MKPISDSNGLVDVSAVITNAIEAARAAYKIKVMEVGDAGAAGFGYISFRLGEINNRPLIRKLADHGHGRFDPIAFDYRLRVDTWIEGEKVQSLAVQEAACRAAINVLNAIGFDARYDGIVD